MRMRNRIAVWGAIGWGVAASSLWAGTDPAAFLNTGVGARAMAMGGAYTSICDDPGAVYWNPAGLGKYNRTGISTMGQTAGASQWDTSAITPRNQFVGVAFPLNTFRLPLLNNDVNTFGVGMISSGLNDIPYTTVDNGGVIQRSSFNDEENAYFVSYGVPVSREGGDLYAGATMKYLTQSFSGVPGASASGYGLDFGLLYSYRSLNLGLVLERGVVMQWANGHTDTAPLTTRFGVSNAFGVARWTTLLGSADLVQRQGQPLMMNIGTELGYEKVIDKTEAGLRGAALRVGVDGFAIEDRYGYRDLINNNTNLTAGAGVMVSLWGYVLELDYAMGSYRLGNRNRISLDMYF